MAIRKVVFGAGLLAALAVDGVALGNPEPMSLYDGRSAAMGGTGVADNDSMAAATLNPANFDMVKKFTATLDYSGIIPTFSAPLFNPMPPPLTVQTTTGSTVTSLPLGGAAYRIFDPLVVGLAAYVAAGSGAAYSDSFKFTFGELEVSLPISFRIIEGLSIGVEPRFGYTKADLTLPATPPMNPPISGSLSGTGWAVTAGINWKPIDSLRLGFSYRSKMSMTLNGTITATTPLGPLPGPDSSTNFATPNTLRVGAAWAILKDLTLSPELRWAAFSGSNVSRTVTINFPPPPAGPGPQTQDIPQNWKNAWTGALGLEYRLLGVLALRAGGTLGNSATPSTTQSAFDVPPGTIASVGGGVGVQVIDALQIDAAVFDQWGSYNVTDTTQGANGTYSLNAFFFMISATLRM